jgi:DNA-binding NarL/FixJ family response regulator
MHSDESYRLKALQNGASAYVRKDAGAAELIQAIQAAAEGAITSTLPSPSNRSSV